MMYDDYHYDDDDAVAIIMPSENIKTTSSMIIIIQHHPYPCGRSAHRRSRPPPLSPTTTAQLIAGEAVLHRTDLKGWNVPGRRCGASE